MHPELGTFSIAGHEVVLRAYSTFLVLAWVVALTLATVVARRRHINWRWSLVTYALALVAGIVGARLLDIAVNWGYYVLHPGAYNDLEFRGFALYGGLILAPAAGGFFARGFHLPAWRLADSAVPALAVGIALMRVGCYLNGSCFGNPTSLPWGVTYPKGSGAWWDIWTHQVATGETGLFESPVPVHPTQVYEIIAAVLFGAVAIWLMRRRSKAGASRTPEGVPFLVFLLGFTLFRLGNHFLRAHPVTFTVPDWFYPLLYCLICVILAGLIVWRLRPWEHLVAKLRRRSP